MRLPTIITTTVAVLALSACNPITGVPQLDVQLDDTPVYDPVTGCCPSQPIEPTPPPPAPTTTIVDPLTGYPIDPLTGLPISG